MLKRTLMTAAAACVLASVPAYAAVTISATPGSDPYTGPVPTYDFESAAPTTGGAVQTGSSGTGAQPFGSTGNYWTVGPAATSPGILDLTSFAEIFSISFIWGSVDDYNTLEVLGAADAVLASFTGVDVALPPDGNRVDPAKNPLVTLLFTGADTTNVAKLRLKSTQNAFETDNYAINAVPEPGTWAMMLLGFGMIGFSLRKRKAGQGAARLRVSFDQAPRLA